MSGLHMQEKLQKALQDAFDIIKNLKEDNIKVDEMRSTLNKMGVSLNDKEFQEVLQTAGVTKDRMVNFNSFMSALEETQHITEFSTLKDVIQAIDKIEADKVVLHELPSFMRNMGIHLPEQEFQQVLKQVSVDDSGKVVVKDFMKILTNSPHFSELSVLKDTIKAVSFIQKDKVSLKDLRSTLRKMGICLSSQEYEELIMLTPADKEGKVDIGQVMKKVAQSRRFSEMEVLNNTIKAFSQLKDDKLNISDVETCLRHMGVHLSKEELAETKKSLKVSSDGTIDINELMSAVKKTRRFSNFAAVHDTVDALKVIKEHKGAQLKCAKSSLHMFGVQFANQVITQVLKSVHMTEAGQTKFNDFLRTLTRNPNFRTSAGLLDAFAILGKLEDYKIGVEELQIVMKNFNITLPSDEISEALAFCVIDDQRKVNLKDFIKGVTHTRTFIFSPELQLTCLVLDKVKGDHFDLHALEYTLDDMDLPEAKVVLQDVMKTAKVDSNGKVNFREFMRIFTLLPEFPEAMVLRDTFNAMSDIKDHYVNMDDLEKTLINVGIHLLPEELQELKSSVTVAGDGTVSFKDIMMALTGTQSFAEFSALQNAFNVISKICKEKIKKEDLLTSLESLGIHLTAAELQTSLVSASIDESGKLDGSEFLKILSSAPRLCEFKALQDATKVVENIKNNKMTVKQLEETLNNMGVHLSKATFNEVVRSAATDERGKISFQDFLLALGETKEFTELESLQRAMTIIDAMHGSRLNLNELDSTLHNLGISLKPEELQQAVHASHMDANGTINLKDFLMTLSNMQHFSDSVGLHSTLKAFGKIKKEKVDVGDLESIAESLGINLSNTELQKALKATSVDQHGKVNFKDFLVSVMNNERFSEPAAVHDAYNVISKVHDDKIEVSQLNDALAAIGIKLTKEEMMEALKNVTVDSDEKVNLKEFMNGLPHMQRFTTAVEMEEAMKTLKSIKQGQVNVEELDSIMHSMGLHLSPYEIQQALKYVTRNDDGSVNVKDFLFGLTKTRRSSQAERDKVSVENLGTILENVGINLTKEEMQEALRRITVDVDGKVNLNEFMRNLRSIQQLSHLDGSQADMVYVEDIDDLLSDMGIHVTKEQLQEALKHVALDENGKVNMTELMTTVVKTRRQSQAEENRVHVHNLNDVLANMNIYLPDDQIQEALKHVIVDENGKVNLNEFMTGVRIVQKIAKIEGTQGGMIAVKDVSAILSDTGVHLTEMQLQEALKHVTLDANGKVNMRELMTSVNKAQRRLQANGEMVETDDLRSTLGKMGIHLTEKEMQEALKHVTIDGAHQLPLGAHKQDKDLFLLLLPSNWDAEAFAASDLGGDQWLILDLHSKEDIFSPTEHSDYLQDWGQDEGWQKPNADGRVNLKNVLESVTATRSPSKFETEGKVNLGEFMNAVETVQQPPQTGEMVEIDDLSSTLTKMGIHLTEEEMEEALKHVTLDADGRMNLKNVLDSVMATRSPSKFESLLRERCLTYGLSQLKTLRSQFHEEHRVKTRNIKRKLTGHPSATGDKVVVEDLKDILANAGIGLTKEEMREALKYVTVDSEGKVNLGEFMKVVKTIQPQPQTGKMVETDDLSSTLAKMGIHLTEEEMQEALKHVSLDADGRVNLKNVLDSVMATRSPSKFERDKVVVQDLKDILGNAGISLTEEEMWEALKHATVDAEGKVNLGEFMKAVKTIQQQPQTEKKVDIDCLDAVLEEMGICLTNKQLYEALKYVPMDADGKVNLEALKRAVNAILKGPQTEKRVDVNILDAVLARMGLHLTQEEIQEAIKLTTLNKDGTVNLKDFMWAAQGLPSIQNKRVNISNLDAVLAGMGIYLTHEEVKNVLKMTTLNEDGTVNLKNFIKICNATLNLSSVQGSYLNEMSDAKLLKLPKVMEKHYHQKIKVLSSESSFEMTKFKAAKKLTQRQMEAFHNAYDTFCKDLDGCVDLPALETTAHKLGISLTEEEAYDELVYADADGDGRVSFTDFLSIITDSRLFVQAVAPKKGDMETVDARGILFFELLSKLVESCLLPRNTTVHIVSYYRQKFLESTGKRAWRSDSMIAGNMQEGFFQKKGQVKKAQCTPMSAFAGAARICVMKDKELRNYVKQLQASAHPSDSPYAQVPIFPLIPNRDGKMQGRPKKNIHKLEVQRRTDPLSSFEDHFFHKKRWHQEKAKPMLTSRPSLTLTPDLTKRRRRLTIDNLEEIRKEVKKATDAYQKAIALQERNKSLKLWRRVRGSEVGLEAGNPSFYQTFSTYTWSWNVCQELLTPRELQEYDRKLYNSLSQLSTSADKQIKADARQRGRKK